MAPRDAHTWIPYFHINGLLDILLLTVLRYGQECPISPDMGFRPKAFQGFWTHRIQTPWLHVPGLCARARAHLSGGLTRDLPLLHLA